MKKNIGISKLLFFGLVHFLLFSCSLKAKDKSKKVYTDGFIKEYNSNKAVKFDSVIQLKNSNNQILFVKQKFTKGKSIANLYLKTDRFKQDVNLIIEDQDPLENVLLYDLNLDGNDEVFLFTRSAGSGSYAGLISFLSNRNTLLPIKLPEIKEEDLNEKGCFHGYKGHDVFELFESELIRKFPIYNDGDPNSTPTGGNRIIIYQLKKSFNQWKFEIEDAFLEKQKTPIDQ